MLLTTRPPQPPKKPQAMQINPSQMLGIINAEMIALHAHHWHEAMKLNRKIWAVTNHLYPDHLQDIEILDQLSQPKTTLFRCLKDILELEDSHVKSHISHLRFEVMRDSTTTKDLLDQEANGSAGRRTIPPFMEAATATRYVDPAQLSTA